MEILFIISAAIITYTYIGYPLLLTLFSKKRHSLGVQHQSNVAFPELTVVIAMYNAQERIIDRLSNLIDTDYPLEKLHIIIVSDGSTDSCSQLARSFDYSRLTVIDQKENQGKSMALNMAIPHVKSPLVAFADVRQNFNRRTLPELALKLADNNVGAVTGNLIIEQNQNLGASNDPGLYWKYEKFIRATEGNINSVVGVTGAIYMMKTALHQKLPADTILDDVYTPMSVVKQGKRVVMASKALAYDYSSHSIDEEFHRKVRTLAGNYQLMALLPWLNSPLKNPIFWQWFSHKVCRLIIPFALILVFFTSFLLDSPIYTLSFYLQIAFYILATIGYLKMRKGLDAGLFSLPATFTILNLAALIAFFKYCFLSPKKLWKKH